MPLPTSGQDWPPRDLSPITAKQAEWDAWYVGDPGDLQKVYAANTRPVVDKVAQYRGGVTGAFARMWWGRPVGDLTRAVEDDKLHVPIAADMCQASADLLFAEPPSLVSVGNQDEIDKAIEGGLFSVLAEGAEIGAALGDVYYRTTWDRKLDNERSFVTAVHADAAIPQFRWGRMVAVTFWWVVRTDGQQVWRHLERHELDGVGNGVIFHGLYVGTTDKLGRQVPLTEHDSTAGIDVDEESKVDTLTPGLAAVHVPNQRPQRRWRNLPTGRDLGRSDLDGVEPMMDKLDMVYSSWMRDVRLAKSRIIVPSYMLEVGGPGAGAGFDTEQDVFTTVNAPPREDGTSQITPQQFAIRTEEHKVTAEQLVTNILRTAGYSQQTFGEGDDGAAITATEVNSKDRRSNLTRDRKIRGMKPAIDALIRKKLAIDKTLFGAQVDPAADLKVEFVDVTQADPEVLARTSETLFRAQSASVHTRVQMMHPDWDDTAVQTEAAAILAEFGAVVPDAGSFRPGVDDAAPVDGGDLVVDSADAGQS